MSPSIAMQRLAPQIVAWEGPFAAAEVASANASTAITMRTAVTVAFRDGTDLDRAARRRRRTRRNRGGPPGLRQPFARLAFALAPRAQRADRGGGVRPGRRRVVGAPRGGPPDG